MKHNKIIEKKVIKQRVIWINKYLIKAVTLYIYIYYFLSLKIIKFNLSKV